MCRRFDSDSRHHAVTARFSKHWKKIAPVFQSLEKTEHDALFNTARCQLLIAYPIATPRGPRFCRTCFECEDAGGCERTRRAIQTFEPGWPTIRGRCEIHDTRRRRWNARLLGARMGPVGSNRMLSLIRSGRKQVLIRRTASLSQKPHFRKCGCRPKTTLMKVWFSHRAV